MAPDKYRLNYPSGGVGWTLNVHFAGSHIFPPVPPNHCFASNNRATSHHDRVMTTRGESRCVQSLTLHSDCQSVKFQGHAAAPKFPAKPGMPPPHLYLLCLPRATSKMLTCGEVRNCQCRKMKCTCTSHFVRAGLDCLSQELYTISPGTSRGRLLMGDECLQDTDSAHACVYVCVLVCRRGGTEEVQQERL